jgi:hypothetical protein
VHRGHCAVCRGLQGMLNQRRKLLAYLRRDNFPRYAFVLHKLGLKDTYAKQVGKQGTAACSAPAAAAVPEGLVFGRAPVTRSYMTCHVLACTCAGVALHSAMYSACLHDKFQRCVI